MIGGVQRYTAVKQIVAENPDCGIETRRCAVYASDLSTAAQVVLARQHNEINQIQCVTTISELASCCRRFAFQDFGSLDVVPKGQSKEYKQFKTSCVTYLKSTKTVSVMSKNSQHVIMPCNTYRVRL